MIVMILSPLLRIFNLYEFVPHQLVGVILVFHQMELPFFMDCVVQPLNIGGNWLSGSKGGDVAVVIPLEWSHLVKVTRLSACLMVGCPLFTEGFFHLCLGVNFLTLVYFLSFFLNTGYYLILIIVFFLECFALGGSLLSCSDCLGSPRFDIDHILFIQLFNVLDLLL